MRAALKRGAMLVASVAVAAGVWAVGAREVAFVRVAGGSMYPALRAGDVCIVRLKGRFETGDVVLFREPGHRTRVLHRVRALGADGVVTQGDANPVADFEPLPPRSVIGRVAVVVPLGRAFESLAARAGR